MNPITIEQTFPSFVTFDPAANIYSLKPADPKTDLGTFVVKGILSDSILTTPFQFTITVVKKAPIFSGGKGPSDLTMMVDTEKEI